MAFVVRMGKTLRRRRRFPRRHGCPDARRFAVTSAPADRVEKRRGRMSVSENVAASSDAAFDDVELVGERRLTWFDV